MASFKALGTSWDIISDEVITDAIMEEIKGRLELFENTYSRFRDNSLISEISRKEGIYTFPEDSKQLFEIYRKLYEVTGGMVTPLMGKVLVDAGYDAKYSLKPKESVAAAPQWDEVMKYEYPKLTAKVPVHLDFGAAGKGYAVDLTSEILIKKGIKNFMVNAGGDIRVVGKALRVGLENPLDTTQAVGVAEVSNQSICGSAGNRKVWDKYTHIINPNTAESPKNILSVWVTANDTITADGLTTALFFCDPSTLRDFKFEYAIVYSDKTFKKSRNFPGEFFV